MRLDKFIAQQLGVSRAIAGRQIRGNHVTIDGEVVRDSAFKLLPEHEVAYEGNSLTQQNGPRYFMLNKPTIRITRRCFISSMNQWRTSCMPPDV